MLSSDSTSLQLHSQSKVLVPYQQFLIHIRKKNIFEISLLSPTSEISYFTLNILVHFLIFILSEYWFISRSHAISVRGSIISRVREKWNNRVTYHVLRSSSFQSLSFSAVFSSISCKFHGARSPVSEDFYQSTFRSVRSEIASCMPSYCYSETTWEDQVWFKMQGKVCF